MGKLTSAREGNKLSELSRIRVRAVQVKVRSAEGSRRRG